MRPLVLAVIGLLFLIPSAIADEATSLSLHEALRMAYERNPQVIEARQDTEAAKGRWIQERTLPNPEVEVSSTELSEGLRQGSTVGDDSIALSQEVDVLGKFWLRGQAGKHEYRAAQHTLQRTWSEVAFDVTKAYNDLLRSTQRVGVTHENLNVTRQLLDQVQLRYSSGQALRNELLRAQIEAAKAENTVLEAEKQVNVDTATLNILLGRDAQTPMVPSDELTYEVHDFDVDQLLAHALAQRPDLKAQEAEVKAHKAKYQLAISNILDNPTVSAVGTRERSLETGAERVFGLSIRMPIPFWNQNQGAIREAKAEFRKQENARDALARDIGREVLRAVAEARLAQRQVAVWKTGVEQANELVRLATQQYREGDINFITYLEHLGTVRETKVAYVEALATYRTQVALVDQAVAKTLIPPGKEPVR